MSRHWKETLDVNKHIDYMADHSIGGRSPVAPRDSLLTPDVYFVDVCSFTFQFQSIEQLRHCLSYFQIKIHPSGREAHVNYEHYWQPWYQRLPQYLFEEPKRKKVVVALERAQADFEAGRGERG